MAELHLILHKRFFLLRLCADNGSLVWGVQNIIFISLELNFPNGEMKFNFRKFITAPALAVTLAVTTLVPSQASAGDNPFIGEVMLFAGNFCPRNYAEANG